MPVSDYKLTKTPGIVCGQHLKGSGDVQWVSLAHAIGHIEHVGMMEYCQMIQNGKGGTLCYYSAPHGQFNSGPGGKETWKIEPNHGHPLNTKKAGPKTLICGGHKSTDGKLEKLKEPHMLNMSLAPPHSHSFEWSLLPSTHCDL